MHFSYTALANKETKKNLSTTCRWNLQKQSFNSFWQVPIVSGHTTKMNTLKRRGRHLWSTMSEKAKNFSVQRSSKVHPQKRKKKAPHSCISPELACDVIKRRITDKVIWTSLILRLTFHLIWVSMTARDVHGKVGSLFQQLIRLAKTSGQDNKKKN